ncbi:Zinc finger, C2H2 type [Popillia japonica]|uniref:Zinc finger, C2H2 type n=1 Tax=Popillia japonica TaxID=7064 RepID=A0AAW1MK89_POPJA
MFKSNLSLDRAKALTNELTVKKSYTKIEPQGPQKYQCVTCFKVYKSRSTLCRHVNLECGVEPRYPCPFCPKKCRQKVHLKSHLARRHGDRFVFIA